ncbi:MAG: hypothetical protein U9Q87_18170, partial [Pseudomonadota bacterium]|nr:hypothetical protein [Pseudomonadota bacterium]
MKLHANITRTAPFMEITLDPKTLEESIAEAKDYDFYFISPGYYLCVHGNNAYAISEYKKRVGCACPDMTYRCKPPRDSCKHLRVFCSLEDLPSKPATPEMAELLKAAGWIGKPLHPPEMQKRSKKKPPKDPDRKPQPQAPTRAQKMQSYAGKTTEEIVRSMPLPELQRNAKRGGVACVAELERRTAAG